jgi:hypothetical protein
LYGNLFQKYIEGHFSMAATLEEVFHFKFKVRNFLPVKKLTEDARTVVTFDSHKVYLYIPYTPLCRPIFPIKHPTHANMCGGANGEWEKLKKKNKIGSGRL